MYHLTPHDLSTAYTFAELSALSRSAARFISALFCPAVPVRFPKNDAPDRAGFRRFYGAHFKTRL